MTLAAYAVLPIPSLYFIGREIENLSGACVRFQLMHGLCVITSVVLSVRIAGPIMCGLAATTYNRTISAGIGFLGLVTFRGGVFGLIIGEWPLVFPLLMALLQCGILIAAAGIVRSFARKETVKPEWHVAITPAVLAMLTSIAVVSLSRLMGVWGANAAL